MSGFLQCLFGVADETFVVQVCLFVRGVIMSSLGLTFTLGSTSGDGELHLSVYGLY